mmetsp:Transcript_8419/g.11067  ORF Transcript_8419/g.11067 Transcript_8419/m.11067 type:complete len:360 (-) Transcript_8419:205-1284(-)|eukprot:CAMPEP_0198143368 /NCGR_PEP_ID=MMETSP1443-20131203/6856_1 /TAXON_ID=186043 /ORGANISM="Entomoneis sp., Strain CCMP2396" /LENGTH=359 /DNA_ID=CAMNT_0043806595 /DNA_START=139 /DNA_END=1218 /DNA_ORIENTATION=-
MVYEDSASTTTAGQPQPKPLNLLKVLMGNCYCEVGPASGLMETVSPTIQFVELHGMRFIGLGCMSDELTPRERVYDTLEQMTDRSERLISIGYIMPENKDEQSKITQTIPLDVWNKTYPNDSQLLSRPVRNLVDQIKKQDYQGAKLQLSMQLAAQKKNLSRGNNPYLAGITAHNLAVVMVLSGDEEEAISLFQDAVDLKEQAFGRGHFEVVNSWDELGIQYFADSQFDDALTAFQQAQKVRTMGGEKDTAGMAMVLNNIACCNFQLRNFKSASLTLKEARVLQQNAMGKQQPQCADLDLLYKAIVMCNGGYLYLCLKMYEEARSLFEEALLIQQSVLDENHRAIRDTRSNLEFTNAFHM